jgi:phosphate transport system permease protein
LAVTSPLPSLPARATRRSLGDRIGDPALRWLSALAAVISVVVLLGIAYEVFKQSGTAFSQFGFGFITTSDWNPVANNFGAASFIYGTFVSSAVALLVAGPLSIAIALFLTELAPRSVRRPVAILVDLLAAIPSVILGLWGIIVLGPVMKNTIEPALQSVLGWIPLFSGSTSALGLLTASVILTIMALPIVTSVTREVFETVPPDLKEASYALGATRWEMVKQVVLPYSRPGIVGAVMLGLGRAIGEAIAVTQVIGAGLGIHASLFATADTLASRIASQFQGAPTDLLTSSLFYLGAILLVFALIVNVVARMIIEKMTLREAP